MKYEYKADLTTEKIGVELAVEHFKVYDEKEELLFQCPYEKITSLNLFPPDKEQYFIKITAQENSFLIGNYSFHKNKKIHFQNKDYREFIETLHQRIEPYETGIEFRKDQSSFNLMLLIASLFMLPVLILLLAGGFKIIIDYFSEQRLLAAMLYVPFLICVICGLLYAIFRGFGNEEDKFYLPGEIPENCLPPLTE